MELAGLILGIIAVLISGVTLVMVYLESRKGTTTLSSSDLKQIKDSVSESVSLLSSSVSDLMVERNKVILDNVTKELEEVNKKIAALNETSTAFNTELKDNLNNFEKDFIEKYNKQKDEIMEKLSLEIKTFNEEVKKSLESSDKSIKEKLEDFKKDTKESLKELSGTVSDNLKAIRNDNNEKLDQINKSVNEKLEKTLEDKLKDSFKSVIEGIGSVNQAVGEIKGLASDVGSLKNVLTNVKTKGILGEVILGNIIKECLTAGQYEENVATKKNSTERVEFAIKLPGTKDDMIYLPIDSKFPYEAYSIISESSDIDEINKARKDLRQNLLKYAKDVSEKYIDVPNTTDFAIIFLPLEGLYLEALNMGLFEEIQSKYKVNLTGPTTFTAFINALNVGFRSLMIQKKSADVFKLLGAVKTEFNKFAEALEKTQKKVNSAAEELDTLVGTRTKMMNSKLKSIDTLDEETTKLILGDTEED